MASTIAVSKAIKFTLPSPGFRVQRSKPPLIGSSCAAYGPLAMKNVLNKGFSNCGNPDRPRVCEMEQRTTGILSERGVLFQ